VKVAEVAQFLVAATSGADATVWWYDGSSDYLLLDAYTMQPNTTEQIPIPPLALRKDQKLKVKTSEANNLTFIAVIRENLGLQAS